MTETPNPNEVPRDPRERKAWVMFQLRIRGHSFASLGREIGITRNSMQAVMYMPAYRTEVALATALGLEVQQLFPERYDASGRRLHQIREDKGSTGSKRRNVYSKQVA